MLTGLFILGHETFGKIHTFKIDIRYKLCLKPSSAKLSPLPAETFEITKGLLALFLTRPRQNAEEIYKIYVLHNYGDIHCITT